MELRDIEYFAVVAEHRNLGRASEVLGLSPTALSKSLRRLEKSLQAKLVTRTPKGVELTTEGDALLARVRGLRLSLHDVAREVSDLAQGRLGRLRIGVGPSPAVELLLASASAALLKIAPQVTMVITMGRPDSTLAALRDGELYLVIRALPVQLDESLVQEPLVYDEIVVIASATHPLTGRKKVTVKDLARQRWALSPADTVVRRRFNQVFEARGIPPPAPVVEFSSALLKLRMVAASDLLSFMPIWWLENQPPGLRLVEIPVKEMTWRRSSGVIYRKDAYLSPAARRFIEILKSPLH